MTISQRAILIAIVLAFVCGVLLGATVRAGLSETKGSRVPSHTEGSGFGSPAPTAGPYSAFLGWAEPSERPESSTPTPTVEPSATPKVVKKRAVVPASARFSVSGTATWWDTFGSGSYAAAGPALIRAMGPGYLGRWVTVCSGGSCVRAHLTTSCKCPGGRVIDLAKSLFAQLADPGLGVIPVKVSW